MRAPQSTAGYYVADNFAFEAIDLYRKQNRIIDSLCGELNVDAGAS